MINAEQVKDFSKLRKDFLRVKAKGKFGSGFNYNKVLWELSQSIQEWCAAHSENADQFEDRLYRCDDLLSSVQYATNKELANLDLRDDSSLTDKEKTRKAEIENSLWTNVEPEGIFHTGYGSDYYRMVDREDLNSIVAEYLSKPWLQSNRLEHLFLVALIFNEMVQYGEKVKQNTIGEKTGLFKTNPIYEKAQGDLSKMKDLKMWRDMKIGIFIELPLALAKLATFVIAPLILLDSQYKGYYVLALAIYLGFSRLIKIQSDNPKEKAIEGWTTLYAEMKLVWHSLQGPVINPSLIQDRLKSSAMKGVLWDNSVHCIVGRLVSRDPNVFVP